MISAWMNSEIRIPSEVGMVQLRIYLKVRDSWPCPFKSEAEERLKEKAHLKLILLVSWTQSLWRVQWGFERAIELLNRLMLVFDSYLDVNIFQWDMEHNCVGLIDYESINWL